jgi:hypothetical protein
MILVLLLNTSLLEKIASSGGQKAISRLQALADDSRTPTTNEAHVRGILG